jgi:methyltransferase family protein
VTQSEIEATTRHDPHAADPVRQMRRGRPRGESLRCERDDWQFRLCDLCGGPLRLHGSRARKGEASSRRLPCKPTTAGSIIYRARMSVLTRFIDAARTAVGSAADDWALRQLSGKPALPDEPVSRTFGFDRGKPIDRWYIEQFLETHAADVRGRVLEVAEDTYTRWYGGDRVIRSDVLYARPGHPDTTIVGDLTTGIGITESTFDCFICTQTLPFIYDVRAAVAGICRLLAPNGVVLATLPGISQISRADRRDWGDWWRFTEDSARRLFGDVFGLDHVAVEQHGNVRTAAAFLYGLAVEDLPDEAFAPTDPDFHLLLTVRAVRPEDLG